MKTSRYRAEVAERYIEYLHSNTFPPRAREKRGKFTRLAINDIPFWKSIDFGALLTEIRQDDSDLFVNISLEPDKYQTYLSRVVPYAESIVLADPIPTLYEWRDRSVVNDEEFDALLDQVLNTLLPLYPLIESGILILLPQPLLWNNELDAHISKIEHKLLSNKSLVESLLIDHEEGLEARDVIQRWLDSHSDVPDGWKENPDAFAQVNIIAGGLNDLVNGVMLSTILGGNITTSSVNTWRHIQKAIYSLPAKSESPSIVIAEVLPLTDLPYVSKPDWRALVALRNDCRQFANFRKEIHKIYRDLQVYGPSAGDSLQRALQLSKVLRSRVSELHAERQRLFRDFQPALVKTLLAGASALLGSQPLAVALAGLAFFDACRTIQNFRSDAQKMKKNALMAVFSECSEGTKYSVQQTNSADAKKRAAD